MNSNSTQTHDPTALIVFIVFTIIHEYNGMYEPMSYVLAVTKGAEPAVGAEPESVPEGAPLDAGVSAAGPAGRGGGGRVGGG